MKVRCPGTDTIAYLLHCTAGSSTLLSSSPSGCSSTRFSRSSTSSSCHIPSAPTAGSKPLKSSIKHSAPIGSSSSSGAYSSSTADQQGAKARLSVAPYIAVVHIPATGGFWDQVNSGRASPAILSTTPSGTAGVLSAESLALSGSGMPRSSPTCLSSPGSLKMAHHFSSAPGSLSGAPACLSGPNSFKANPAASGTAVSSPQTSTPVVPGSLVLRVAAASPGAPQTSIRSRGVSEGTGSQLLNSKPVAAGRSGHSNSTGAAAGALGQETSGSGSGPGPLLDSPKGGVHALSIESYVGFASRPAMG